MEARQTPSAQVIFHIDMNSFYASVEMAHDPALKGKPLAIAGNVEERRGIIVTSSYEARAKGVRTTMPVWQAKRLCPDLIVMPPNFTRYRESSQKLFDLLRSYTSLVEPVSIDEGYMDVTDIQGIHPVKLAQVLQKRIFQELHLPSSIGIAPNKFLAKMASDMKKPMGLTILRKRDLAAKLWPLPLGEMHGVGPKTEEKLKSIGFETIKDLALSEKGRLIDLLGSHGEKLHDRANGKDERRVDPEAASEFKSIGQSTTLPEDTTNEHLIFSTFSKLAEKLSSRLKAKHVRAYHLSIMIRYYNWVNVSRGNTLKQPVQTVEEIMEQVRYLFSTHWNSEPIRLLGISTQNLREEGQAYKQLDIFSYEDDAKEEPLFDTLDFLKEKYGEHIIQKGIYHENEKKR